MWTAECVNPDQSTHQRAASTQDIDPTSDSELEDEEEQEDENPARKRVKTSSPGALRFLPVGTPSVWSPGHAHGRPLSMRPPIDLARGNGTMYGWHWPGREWAPNQAALPWH